MQSVRRSVLLAAASASRAASSGTVSVTAAPLARSMAASAVGRSLSMGVAASVASSLAASRFFSQSARVRAEEEPGPPESEKTPASEAAGEAAPNAPAPGETPYGIFVRNIVFDATNEHLVQAFSHYGTVTKATVIRDARGLSKGFAFLWYEQEEEMKRAISEADGMFWHGRRMTVAPRTSTRSGNALPMSGNRQSQALNRPANEPSESLYVGNMPYEMTDTDLNELFRGLEGIGPVRVAVDQTTGWPRGFAHADFATVEQATKAMEELRKRKVGDRELRVDFARPSRDVLNRRGKTETPKEEA